MGASDILDRSLAPTGAPTAPSPSIVDVDGLRADVAALRADLAAIGPQLAELTALAGELRPLVAQLATGKVGAIMRAMAGR